MPSYFYIDIILALSFIAPIVAILVYFKVMEVRPQIKKDLIALTAFLSLLCLIGFMISYTKFEAKFQDWFFEGELVKTEVFVEGDGETVDHYENRFYLDFTDKPEFNMLGMVRFLMLMGILGGFAIGFYTWSQSIPDKEKKAEETDNENILIITKIILATGLLLCLLDLPYRYYDIFRFVMLFGCIYLASCQYKMKHFGSWLFFAIMAILFNPIYEIHLTRLLWNTFDIALAVVFLAWAVKEYIDNR